MSPRSLRTTRKHPTEPICHENHQRALRPETHRVSLTHVLNPATLVPKPPHVGDLFLDPLEDTAMNCRTIGLIFTLAMVLAPLASDAQQPARVPVIGELMSGSPPSEAQRQPG